LKKEERKGKQNLLKTTKTDIPPYGPCRWGGGGRMSRIEARLKPTTSLLRKSYERSLGQAIKRGERPEGPKGNVVLMLVLDCNFYSAKKGLRRKTLRWSPFILGCEGGPDCS